MPNDMHARYDSQINKFAYIKDDCPECEKRAEDEAENMRRLQESHAELLEVCEVAYHVLKTTEADNYPKTISMLFKAISKAKGELTPATV